uniref:Uncharacterized protein n=1 Tax=Brassica campestris TaxID=3711 RepID=A0A3P6CES3_BRACM|nr:unnamed protein product [Brassica rapa]
MDLEKSRRCSRTLLKTENKPRKIRSIQQAQKMILWGDIISWNRVLEEKVVTCVPRA